MQGRGEPAWCRLFRFWSPRAGPGLVPWRRWIPARRRDVCALAGFEGRCLAEAWLSGVCRRGLPWVGGRTGAPDVKHIRIDRSSADGALARLVSDPVGGIEFAPNEGLARPSGEVVDCLHGDKARADTSRARPMLWRPAPASRSSFAPPPGYLGAYLRHCVRFSSLRRQGQWR